MPNEVVNLSQNPESFMQGERLYRSFVNGLSLVAEAEKKYACAVVGVEPTKLKNIESNFSVGELTSLTNNFRDLFYGQDERSAKYDQLIDKAIAHNTQADPDHYAALNNHEIVAACKALVRGGLLSEVTQHRVDDARAERHRRQHQHRSVDMAVKGVKRSLKEASKVDDLIAFNHLARDLVNSPLGKMMNLNRDKTREILRISMLGDRQTAEMIEHGTAIELAAMKVFEHDLGRDAVVFGNIGQDKQGGDIVLFPHSDHEVYLDVKQTPPNKIRRQLSYSQMDEPGIYWENPQSACLWLGSQSHISDHYVAPSEFVMMARQLIAEAQPQAAIA